MPTLTAAQVAQLNRDTMFRNAQPGRLTFAIGNGRTVDLDVDAIRERLTNATAIVLRESGGNTSARCDDSTPRPDLGGRTCNSPGRGTDRGLWQWNSRAWPNITDAMADDPTTATQLAWEVSEGFAAWGPWRAVPGSSTPQYQAARAAVDAVLDGMTVDAGDVITDVIPDAVGGVVDAVTPDWAEGLGRLLGRVLDPSFWRRIGIGVLGAVLLLVGAAQLTGAPVMPAQLVRKALPV